VCSRDLESFGIKHKTTWDGLLFICLKLSETVLELEPLLIVLELISSGSGLKPLLIKVLSAVIQD
jgi:hypothetical protein